MVTLEVLVPFSFFLIIFFSHTSTASKKDDCISMNCGDIPIRFPFRLKNLQHNKNCGYPGFELSCNKKNQTILELPIPGNFVVRYIDYTKQEMEIYDFPDTTQEMEIYGPDGCLRNRTFDFNLSADSPLFFLVYSAASADSPLKGSELNYTLFNCPKNFTDDRYKIICLNKPNSTYNIGAIREDSSIANVDLVQLENYCIRTGTITTRSLPSLLLNDFMSLGWDKPAGCRKCESDGRQCGFNSNYTSLDDIGCFQKVDEGTWRKNTEIGTWRNICKYIGVIGLFVFLVATLTINGFIEIWTQTDDKDEIEKQLKIEKFLENYKDLTPTRYSYADIRKMTNKFQRQLGEGGYGSVYEGKLNKGIPVAVKVLKDSHNNGEDFINEVGTIGRIHHKNVVRLLGFCADGFRRALIYEFMPKESLEKFIFSSGEDKNPFFGWEKLQEISIGIARGIEYLHQGCEQRILHFDIKPHNILLDHKYNPKISDFGLAKLCSKGDSIVSMTAARGTMGYIAPEVFSRNFGKVSTKSDVYSFGMLLLEMVGRRKNIEVKVDKASQVYFPEWIYSRLQQGEELGIEVDTEEDATIARKLAIAALWCIQWNPVDRPSMKSVIQMLEGNSENLIMPPNPFTSSASAMTSTTMPGKLQQQIELTVIEEEPE